MRKCRERRHQLLDATTRSRSNGHARAPRRARKCGVQLHLRRRSHRLVRHSWFLETRGRHQHWHNLGNRYANLATLASLEAPRRGRCEVLVPLSIALVCLCWLLDRGLAVTPRGASGRKPATSLRLIPRVMCWRLRIWHQQGLPRVYSRGQELHDWSRCNVDANGRVSSILSAVIFCLGGGRE